MKDQIIAKVNELIEAETVNDGLKAAATAYVDAAGTDGESAAAESLVQSLKNNVNYIDESLDFFKTDMGRQVFGDAVDGFISSFEEAKAKGEKYCMCPACQAGKDLLSMQDEILA